MAKLLLAIAALLGTVGLSQAAEGERVRDGLVALFTFEGTEAEALRDRSGQTPALDLVAADPEHIELTEGALVIRQPTLLQAPAGSQRLTQAIRQAGEATLEAWIDPRDLHQAGPARVLTLSKDTMERNFTLGQAEAAWEARFRTTQTSPSGIPATRAPLPPSARRPDMVHLVYTRDHQGVTLLYVDGAPRNAAVIPGQLASWDHTMPLALANEIDDERPWLGELHLVALYETVLDANTVAEHYQAGRQVLGTDQAPVLTVNPLALYTFTENEGQVVQDYGVGEPLDLAIENPAATEWLPGALRITGPNRLLSAGAADKISSACELTGQLTIEAWVRPASLALQGPARIVTMSRTGAARNFTLGQEQADVVVRMRTTETGPNGMAPELQTAGVLTEHASGPAGGSVHVVYTWAGDDGGRLYINGRMVAENREVVGDLSNWDETMVFALANELTGDRPWLGRIELVAVYARALAPDEVLRNFEAGPEPGV